MDSVEKGAREAFPAPTWTGPACGFSVHPGRYGALPLWERGSIHGGINRIGSGSHCNLRPTDSCCSAGVPE